MEQGSTAPGAVRATISDPAGASRASLGEKLETLEQGARDMVQGAGTAVTDMVEAVKTAVGETVDDLKGVWQEGAVSLGHAFDLRRHVRQHPWFTLGGTALVGYGVGRLIGGTRR
jgi:ElaB/YqjD/DUF883 family membrane-anchored ribosome-binding protein